MKDHKETIKNFYNLKDNINKKKDYLFNKGKFQEWDLNSMVIGDHQISMQDITKTKPYTYKFLLPNVTY